MKWFDGDTAGEREAALETLLSRASEILTEAAEVFGNPDSDEFDGDIHAEILALLEDIDDAGV